MHADPLVAAEIDAAEEIRAAFNAFFAGQPARVPYVGCGMTNTLGIQTQSLPDAITDALTDGEPRAALVALLQGTGDVSALRAALCADYITRNADSIAQQRVVFDAPQVHKFAMEGAIA